MHTRTLSLLSFSLVAACPAAADKVTLNAVADTALFSIHPDNNYGAVTTLPMGGILSPGEEGRVLLRFNPANGVTAGGEITAVTLQISIVKQPGGGTDEVIDVHRMLTAWGEGTKSASRHGSTAGPGEASWNTRIKATANWGVPGGKAGTDFATTPSASLKLGNPAVYTFSSSPGLIDDVKAWIKNPEANFGWMLKAQTPLIPGSAKRVAARESGTGVAQLFLEFKLPAPRPAFTSFKLAGNQCDLRFHGEPGNIYEIQFQDVLGAAAWLRLTNFFVKLTPIDASVLVPVDQPQRSYRLAITGQID